MITLLVIILLISACEAIYIVNLLFKGKLSYDEIAGVCFIGTIGVTAAHYAIGNLFVDIFKNLFGMSTFNIESGLVLSIIFSMSMSTLYIIFKGNRKKELIGKAQEAFTRKIQVDNQLRFRKMVVEIIDEFNAKNNKISRIIDLLDSSSDESIEIAKLRSTYENYNDRRILEFLSVLEEYVSPADKEAIEKNPAELYNVYDRLKIEIEYLENQKQAWELVK